MLKKFDLFSPKYILIKDLNLPGKIYNSLRHKEIYTIQELIDLFEQKN